jgi:hypothetical protein
MDAHPFRHAVHRAWRTTVATATRASPNPIEYNSQVLTTLTTRRSHLPALRASAWETRMGAPVAIVKTLAVLLVFACQGCGESGDDSDASSQAASSGGGPGSGATGGGASSNGASTGAASGSGATTGAASGGGGSTGGASGGFFSSDIESTTLDRILVDVNQYGGVETSISTDVAHSGSHAIKITYTSDEGGVELKPAPFAPTTSLFVRKHEYFAPGWEGNWPVGLKTSRCFTRSDWGTENEPNAYAYLSEKLVWQTYDGDPDDLYARGLNSAVFNLDIEATYPANTLFGNDLPYVRTEHWYKMETWLVLNSAVDAEDGVMQIWIDDQIVLDRSDVAWRSTSRGVPNGDAWQSMWFGGNYSGAVFGGPSQPVHRYIDDIYLSTTLDR